MCRRISMIVMAAVGWRWGVVAPVEPHERAAFNARQKIVSSSQVLRRPALVWAAMLAILAGAQGARGNVGLYEPEVDPGLGFNMISWFNFDAAGAGVWEEAVQDLYDHGGRHVSISPVRFFDKSTGAIQSSSPKAPELAHIAAGVQKAKSLGMSVTLNPFVEPINFDGWRGAWTPPNSSARTQFFSDYQNYMVEVAGVAEAAGADRMTVGTELRDLTRQSASNSHFSSVIGAVDAAYNGKLGYAANWDNFNHSNLTNVIWENPAIDFMGVDSYFPLTSNSQADASGPHPDGGFIDTVASNWTTILDGQLIPFAEARQGGAGLELVLTEHGLIPFNRTTVQPFSESPGFSQPLDQGEQVNGYEALLTAIDGRLADLAEVHLWHWGMPGAADSFWYLDPEGVDVGGSKYAESLSAPAAMFLSDYLKTIPEPSTLALVIGGGLFCGARRRRAA